MLDESPLIQKTPYKDTYDPDLLFPVPRTLNREQLGIIDKLPFDGSDIWNGYELSWLDSHGKPIVATAEFSFPCQSPNVVESKSFKLYLNSFNQTHFYNDQEVLATMINDLSDAAGALVAIKLMPLTETMPAVQFATNSSDYLCLDTLNIAITDYQVNTDYLRIQSNEQTHEKLVSHLLKSNCPMTNQPDWGSVFIEYTGQAIDHAGLLQYIISHRNHNGFAEHAVEQIYMDLLKHCEPTKLTVYGRYNRRGGLDINPFRSNFGSAPENVRLWRQ